MAIHGPFVAHVKRRLRQRWLRCLTIESARRRTAGNEPDKGRKDTAKARLTSRLMETRDDLPGASLTVTESPQESESGKAAHLAKGDRYGRVPELGSMRNAGG